MNRDRYSIIHTKMLRGQWAVTRKLPTIRPGIPYNSCMERLNKYLAHAGIGSRRHCDELIAHGRVAINGSVVRELGTKVGDHCKVSVDGKEVHGEKTVWWVVNKPRGYLCTNRDPAGRP